MSPIARDGKLQLYPNVLRISALCIVDFVDKSLKNQHFCFQVLQKVNLLDFPRRAVRRSSSERQH